MILIKIQLKFDKNLIIKITNTLDEVQTIESKKVLMSVRSVIHYILILCVILPCLVREVSSFLILQAFLNEVLILQANVQKNRFHAVSGYFFELDSRKTRLSFSVFRKRLPIIE